MAWPVETLRDSIQLLCQEHAIDADEIIPDGSKMTPVQAGDKLALTVARMVMSSRCELFEGGWDVIGSWLL